jgi:hypothetical protein
MSLPKITKAIHINVILLFLIVQLKRIIHPFNDQIELLVNNTS